MRKQTPRCHRTREMSWGLWLCPFLPPSRCVWHQSPCSKPNRASSHFGSSLTSCLPPSLPPFLSSLFYPSSSPFRSPSADMVFFSMNKKEAKPIFSRKQIPCTSWWMLAYLAQGKNLKTEISLLLLAKTHAEIGEGVILGFWQSQGLSGWKTDPHLSENAVSWQEQRGEVTDGLDILDSKLIA